MKRFYPKYVPEFPYEPDVNSFSISLISRDVGSGVVSKKVFSPGEIVFGFTGFVLDTITQFSLRAPNGQHIHDPFFMGKILHSCDPNTSCNMADRIFTARKEILPGDLITMDYEETETVLFKPFQCRCGESNCRGLISGTENLSVGIETTIVKGRTL